MAKKDKSPNKWLTLTVLSMAGSIIYKLPYLRETYYIPLQQATGTTNEQLGLLMTAYALANFILYFPGGWAADSFSPRKLIAFSLIATGITGFYFATFPPFPILLLLHAFWAVTTVFTFWSASIRIIRLLGDSKEQGRLFGLWTFGKGLTSVIVGFISVPIFTHLGDGVLGLRGAIIFYSILTILIGILSYLVLDDKRPTEESSRIVIRQMATVLKMPSVWIAGVIVFCSWSVYIGFGMVTPFLTDVFKMSVAFAAIVSIVRAYVLFSAGGLLGGFLADKLGSRIKFMLYAFLGMIAFTGVYYFIPGNPNFIEVVVINLVILGLFVYAGESVFFSIIDEVRVPEHVSGTAAGLISVVGYFPEIFLYTLVGKMVDNNPGVVGYRHIWLFMIACAIIGAVSTAALYKINKNKGKTLQTPGAA
ncbi:inner membrane protein YihN [Peptococcaceae bacterium CEB3]|nr:inner membrane protein YihN [Peptococcaceae bacterium CEB3]